MDHQRIDDALQARFVNDNMRQTTAPKLRRRNMARPKRHHRRLVQRGDDDSDAASGLDPEPDSDDDDITLPQSRPTSLARPSSMSSVGSGLVFLSKTTTDALQPTALRFGASSRTTTGAAQATPLKFAPVIIASAARPTGLGSTLLAAEGDDLESGVESLSEDDDSDDETTTSAPPATTAPVPGETAASSSLTSTTIAATVSSAVSGASPPPPAIGTSPPVTSTSSSLAQQTTLSTAVVAAPAPNTRSSSSSSSSAVETAGPRPTKGVTSAAAVTPAPLSTLSLPSPQLASSQTTTASGVVGEATSDQVLGSVTSVEHKDMSQGEVAGTVVGSLAGVVMIVIAALFIIKLLRRRGYHVPSLHLPFSRAESGDNSLPRMTNSTSWAAPWNRNLWGAASSGTRSTASESRQKNPKTTSEMLDELVQATYAAEGGGAGMAAEKSRRPLTEDLESQSPPSPGSFLDENFIDEKSYAKLEGPWPLRTPAKRSAAAAAPKTPGPVARWLDGVLTPRQSTVVVPPPALVPGGSQMTTRWQPEPPLPVARSQGFEVVSLEKPTPAFAKGSSRDKRMTATTTTSSSVVW